jgi:hypothetical protein
MSGYTKLFSSITESTVWQAPDTTRLVWITMLAMADQNGEVSASVPGLADRARVSIDACVEALALFAAPDEWSRTKDYDGRRIVECDGGWLLLNHAKYREARSKDARREYQRNLMRERRRKEKECALANVSKSEQSEPGLAKAEAEAEAVDQKLLDKLALTNDGEEDKNAAGKTLRKRNSTGDDPLCDLVRNIYDATLPKCRAAGSLTPKRKKRIHEADKMAKDFCKSHGWDYVPAEFWENYFGECLGDPWLSGDTVNPNNSGWKQNIDLLLDEKRFTQIMDGAVTKMRGKSHG